MPRTVVISALGTTLDRGRGESRWHRWRPTVALHQHEDLLVDRLELLYSPGYEALAETVMGDIERLSPETEIALHPLSLADPWDFEAVYAELLDFAKTYQSGDDEELLVHITTGTHVMQICFFLLVESRHLPGKLIQTRPPRRGDGGGWSVIDLDLERYDQLKARFDAERDEDLSFLKAGIATRNARFNRMVAQIERVALSSREPILLMGPTGAGKSQLARRIFALRAQRGLTSGEFVEVNCATLRGDAAMSALFGHVKGAFTGAQKDRAGLLRRADGGVLFLDEIGELGLDEQAMLLHAIEEKRYLPVGADAPVAVDFALLAGTNRDLRAEAAAGRFREDLLARLDVWTFSLPSLAERPEDLEPNLDHELVRQSERLDRVVRMTAEARARFLEFGRHAAWRGNFRDLAAAVIRMSTLAPDRIDLDTVEEEIGRLEQAWAPLAPRVEDGRVRHHLGEAASELDRFDRVQLEDVLRVCERAPSLSAAGRELFAESRRRRASTNDADRLRKYLAKHGLAFADLGAG
ncbi:MAG: RNA repair transcriptional activator RtcR [Sandaracinaceae bacterium]